MRQRHIDKDAPFAEIRVHAPRRWHTTKPLDGRFVEAAGQIRARIGGFRGYNRADTRRSAFLSTPGDRCSPLARVLREF